MAALCVVGTTAVVLTHDGASAPAAGAMGKEWRRTGAGDAIEYRDGGGRTLVRIASPWVYGERTCGSAGSISRAFAGFVPRDGRTAARLADAWAYAISLDVVTGRHLRRDPLTVTRDRADTDVDVPTGPCNPPRAHLTVVTTGDRALVLVRDVGVPDALTASDADRVLTALLPSG